MAWRTSDTGWWTKTLKDKVNKKLKVPKDRSTGVTYA